MLITLKIKKQKAKFFLDLIRHFDFIEITDKDGDTTEDILENIKQSLSELNEFEQGKLELKDAQTLLDEL
jgi:predicted DNA-binding protein YlxM (UPF0122 family)